LPGLVPADADQRLAGRPGPGRRANARRSALSVRSARGDHLERRACIDDEIPAMFDARLAKTANRRVVGVMDEFTHLAGAYSEGQTTVDLDRLSLRLADTPCGPLSTTCGFPDRALRALSGESTDPS